MLINGNDGGAGDDAVGVGAGPDEYVPHEEYVGHG